MVRSRNHPSGRRRSICAGSRGGDSGIGGVPAARGPRCHKRVGSLPQTMRASRSTPGRYHSAWDERSRVSPRIRRPRSAPPGAADEWPRRTTCGRAISPGRSSPRQTFHDAHSLTQSTGDSRHGPVQYHAERSEGSWFKPAALTLLGQAETEIPSQSIEMTHQH